MNTKNCRRERAGAGEDEVTDAGEAEHGERSEQGSLKKWFTVWGLGFGVLRRVQGRACARAGEDEVADARETEHGEQSEQGSL